MSTIRQKPDDLTAKVIRLERWKAQASEVILELQDVGKALGLLLGASAEAARRLTARAEVAEAKVARIEALREHVTALHAEMPEPHGPVTRGYSMALQDVAAALAEPATTEATP